MTPLLFAAVAVAGGVGAGLRYLVDLGVTRWVGARVPWGILAVNLTGSFALGLITNAVAGLAGAWIVGVGLLGGYTTFSTVAVATVLLAEEGRSRASLGYAVGTFAGTVVFAALGLAVGAALR